MVDDEYCNREYTINESGAILRINDRQEGHHGGDRLDPIRIPGCAHAWQSSNFPGPCHNEPLRRDTARQSPAAMDGENNSSRVGGITYLGIDLSLVP